MALQKGVVWITGASVGIGAATARVMAKRGWAVAASARNKDQLEALAKKYRNIHPYPLDVADPVARREVYRKIRADLGPIDVLVNNAGFGLRGAVEEIEFAQLRNMYDVNIFAPLALTKLVLPDMRKRRDGRIVMVSSVVGRVANPFSGAYSSSKFALEGLSDALRREVRPWGIKVILVEPGPIATEFGKRARNGSESKLLSKDSPYAPYYEKELDKTVVPPRMFWGPSTVAEAIRDAIENKKPCTRYPVHWVAWLMPFLDRILPTSLLDRIMGMRHGLNKPAVWQ